MTDAAALLSLTACGGPKGADAPADADEVSDRVQDQVSAFLAYVAQPCGGFPADGPTS